MSGFLYQVAAASGGGVETVTGNLVDNSDPLNPVVSLPYLVYTALWYQNGTSAPTVTILQNTLGSIVWTRTTTGTFAGTLAGSFPDALVWCQAMVNFGTGGGDQKYFANIRRLNDNAVQIIIENLDEVFTWSHSDNLSDPMPPDASTLFVFLEIRVYS